MAISLTSTPDQVSWSRHPIVFSLQSDAAGYTTLKFKVELFLKGAPDQLLTTFELNPDPQGLLELDVADFVNAQLSYEVPDLNGVQHIHASASAGFYIVYYEIVDGAEGAGTTSADFSAVLGANDFMLTERNYLSIDLASDFVVLSAKPNERRLYAWQEEVITVMFTHDQLNLNKLVTLHYSDGSTHQDLEFIPAVTEAQVISFSLGFRARDWNQYFPAKTIERITFTFDALVGDTITYVLQHLEHAYQRSYIFGNKHGGFDVLAATGQQKQSDQTKGEVYVRDQGITGIVSQPTIDLFEQSSGYVPKPEIGAYTQMRDIKQVYLHLKDGQLQTCTLRPQITARLSDGKNLNPFTFTYSAGTGQQNFQVINAIQFIPPEGGGLELPITMNDVTGLVTALNQKASKLVIASIADAATQAIGCLGYDTCIVEELIVNRAAITWDITNIGMYLVITVDHTFAGTSTITLDTTNYEFTGQDGTVITTIDLDKEAIIIGMKTSLTRNTKPVIDLGIKPIDLT